MQHKQDPLQRLPVRQPPTTRIAKPPLNPRQERLDPPHNSSDTTHGFAATGTPSILTADTDNVRHQDEGPLIPIRALRNSLIASRPVKNSSRFLHSESTV